MNTNEYMRWAQFPAGPSQWVQINITSYADLRHDELDAIIAFLKMTRKHIGPGLAKKAALQDLARLDKKAGKLFSFDGVQMVQPNKRAS